MKFQLREHHINVTYDTQFEFIFEPPTYLLMDIFQELVSPRGQGYIFRNFPRSYLHGKKVRYNWAGSTGVPVVDWAFSELLDGHYDRENMTDFPDEGERVGKGSGTLYTFETYNGSFAFHEYTSGVLDLSGGTQDDVCLFFRSRDVMTTRGYFMYLDYVQVLDADDNVLMEEHFTADVTMEVIETQNDYGYVGTEATEKESDEIFTLVEEETSISKMPAMYVNTRDALLAYRNKVMKTIIGGRVEALLDAGHDSLTKYKGKLSDLNLIAYLYKNLRRNALAFGMKGKDIGNGVFRGASIEYDSPVSLYPLTAPFAVPQRNLPSVDVFRFTPYTDIELTERSNIAQLRTFVMIQTDKSEFIDTPDAENAMYDFYFLYPQLRVRGFWDFFNPSESVYVSWTGEYIAFYRELRTAHEELCYLYRTAVWLDVGIEQPSVTEHKRTVEPIFTWNFTYRREHDDFYTPSNAPVIQITIAGQRVPSDDESLLGVGEFAERIIGSTMKAESFTPDWETPNWYNAWKIIVSVNNKEYGTTDPVPDTYTKKALDGFEVLAIPTEPHVFDHWEKDGVNIGNANPYYEYPLKDSELKAVFV